jgi:hypothetical protein
VHLEKFQSNAVFRAIAAGGLEPRECDLTEGDTEIRISHVPSGSYFVLGGSAIAYTGTYVVGNSAVSWPTGPISWTSVPEQVRRWAEQVKQDVETPDLWAELQREREILTGVRYEAVENTPFTPDEQAEIAQQLRAIKEDLKKKYSLSSEQMSRVEARLDEAEAASRRIGRKDWLLLFAGVIFTLIATGLLPPESVHHVFMMIFHDLDHLFGSGRRPPQLPPTT